MAFIKRIFLFMIVNVLVVSVISFVLYIFNIQPFFQKHGISIATLVLFCLIWGMGGAFISLALSRITAKWMMNIEIIPPDTQNPAMRTLITSVHVMAKKAGLPNMPEVGIYRSQEVNAFATGPSRSRALVAVSTGLLSRMNKEEVDGVIGHEITHIANGDMVTMTLLQGVINAFVMFLARFIALALARGGNQRDEKSSNNSSPFMYQMIVYTLEMIFMVFGSLVIARFSRFREFRADAGGAKLAGAQNMISALYALKRTYEKEDPKAAKPALQMLKISAKSSGLTNIFATHPPLDERIARLEKRLG